MKKMHTKAVIAAILTLGIAGTAHNAQAQQQSQQVGQLLSQADQALQRGDAQAARTSVQQARRIMETDTSAELQGDAMDFLRLAQRATDQGALRTAWLALGRAETRLLTRVTTAPQGEQAASGGAIGPIRSARQALTERDIDLASERIERAMALAQNGNAVGSNVSGAGLTGAGIPGPAQPLTGNAPR